MKKVVKHGLVCGMAFGCILVLYFLKPVPYIILIAEDSWLETGTFACFFLSALLMAAVCVIDPQMRKPGYIMFAMGMLFIAMEEISWGQRILGIRTPHFIAEENYQSELTIHNLINFPRETAFYYVIAVWALMLPFLSEKVMFIRRLVSRFGIPVFKPYLGVYVVLGIFLYFKKPLVMTDEIGEFFLSMGFLLYTCGVFFQHVKQPFFAGIPRRSMPVVFAAAVFGLTLLFMNWDLGRFQWRYHAAANNYRDKGLYVQAEQVYQHILNHEEYKSIETFFQYGRLLKMMSSPRANTILLQSLDEHQQWIDSEPEQPGPYRETGKVLLLLEKQDEALAHFQKSLEQDRNRLARATPDWEFAVWRSMAETHYEMGDFARALENWRKAHDLASMGRERFAIRSRIIDMERILD